MKKEITDIKNKSLRTSLRAAILFVVLPSLCFGWTGECVSIIDGDTIEVMNGTTPERIRLYGIDCPEKKQDFGRKASEFTGAMVFRKTVEITPVSKDRHGRTIAYVNVDGKSLNKELLKAGLAWWFR